MGDGETMIFTSVMLCISTMADGQCEAVPKCNNDCLSTTSNFSILIFWNGSLTHRTLKQNWPSLFMVLFPSMMGNYRSYFLLAQWNGYELVQWTASKQPLIVNDRTADNLVKISEMISQKRGFSMTPRKSDLFYTPPPIN